MMYWVVERILPMNPVASVGKSEVHLYHRVCFHGLRFVKRPLRGEKKVVLAAVLNDGLALEYASMAMRSDEEVVATAVKQNRDASRYYVGREELKRLNNKLNKDVEMAERGKKTCEC